MYTSGSKRSVCFNHSKCLPKTFTRSSGAVNQQYKVLPLFKQKKENGSSYNTCDPGAHFKSFATDPKETNTRNGVQ
jgi:hypothetical protein